jgi:hypothetical protein
VVVVLERKGKGPETISGSIGADGLFREGFVGGFGKDEASLGVKAFVFWRFNSSRRWTASLSTEPVFWLTPAISSTCSREKANQHRVYVLPAEWLWREARAYCW